MTDRMTQRQWVALILVVLSLIGLTALAVLLLGGCQCVDRCGVPTAQRHDAMCPPEGCVVSATASSTSHIASRTSVAIEYGRKSGGVVYAESGAIIRHPCTGEWWEVPPGVVVAWTDGVVEVEIDPSEIES